MNESLQKPIRSARKAKGHGHLRRAEILRAAERIFVAEGYEGATIRKIADEVGVSSTCLYMHFQDKDQILIEICQATMEELVALNRDICALPVDPVERVRMLLTAFVGFALNNPNAYRLVFCDPAPAASARKQEATRQLSEQCVERFAGVVREIAAQGRLRTGDPKAAHQALWAACHGLNALMITRPTVDWAPAEDLTRVLVEGMLHGMIVD